MHRGVTLLEMMLTLALLAIATAFAIPGFARLVDSIAVHGASAEVRMLFSSARHTAIHHARPVTITFDTSGQRVILHSEADTFQLRELGTVHGVRLHATRGATTYAPTGVGFGASNLTLIVERGMVADTLTVSRLGRVRR